MNRTGSFVDPDIYGRGHHAVHGKGAKEELKAEAQKKLLAMHNLELLMRKGEYIDCDVYGRCDPRIFGKGSRLQSKKAAQQKLRAMSAVHRKRGIELRPGSAFLLGNDPARAKSEPVGRYNMKKGPLKEQEYEHIVISRSLFEGRSTRSVEGKEPAQKVSLRKATLQPQSSSSKVAEGNSGDNRQSEKKALSEKLQDGTDTSVDESPQNVQANTWTPRSIEEASEPTSLSHQSSERTVSTESDSANSVSSPITRISSEDICLPIDTLGQGNSAAVHENTRHEGPTKRSQTEDTRIIDQSIIHEKSQSVPFAGSKHKGSSQPCVAAESICVKVRSLPANSDGQTLQQREAALSNSPPNSLQRLSNSVAYPTGSASSFRPIEAMPDDSNDTSSPVSSPGSVSLQNDDGSSKTSSSQSVSLSEKSSTSSTAESEMGEEYSSSSEDPDASTGSASENNHSASAATSWSGSERMSSNSETHTADDDLADLS